MRIKRIKEYAKARGWQVSESDSSPRVRLTRPKAVIIADTWAAAKRELDRLQASEKK